jgi:hypothetical protein
MSSGLTAMDKTDGIPAAAVPGSTLVIILALKVLLSPEENYTSNYLQWKLQ